jgi:putative membrane-bound dehydrogenase-like protein
MRSSLPGRRLAGWILLLSFVPLPAAAADPPHLFGAARADITPAHPIRLSGYGGRREEAVKAAQKLWAKALAVARAGEPPLLVLTVDSIGVPRETVEEVAQRVEKKTGLPRERFAVCATHSHTAPCLAKNLETLFGVPVPDEHRERIASYTRELTDRLEAIALEALAGKEPCTLSWGIGKAGFAANRRTPGGPVDHDLPLLRVADASGTTRAVLLSYACHCTTLGPEFNEHCGDWAGYAREYLEESLGKADVLVAIGCGADANPQPRTGLEHAKRHGRELADEARRLLGGELKPLAGKLDGRLRRLELPFDAIPDRAEWETRAKRDDAIGYQAKVTLAKLDRGEKLPSHLPYAVQAWTVGDALALVFLPGEVVVDYSLRLKRELDHDRLWVNAYANDVPCYIPSRRILAEGGYEAGGAMVYYDQPAPLKPEVEDLIVQSVRELVPAAFASQTFLLEHPPPLSPEASRDAIRTVPDLEVELVAAEPLVIDPVAIDFGMDGRVWVVEMHDYPSGLDGNGKPGGRIVALRDTDGDGRLETRSVLLDGVPFPTGVMEWRDGVLACAAPDILFARDVDGDGLADERCVLFTGFGTDNYQARVNGLTWSLDGWVHGANGLLGGTVRKPGDAAFELALGSRDFRLRPEEGLFEPAAGFTQQGLARDDWGEWFGNENWALLRHYPLPERYLRRNPHVPAPNPRVDVSTDAEPNRLYPRSRTLERFNDPHMVNVTTSACGPGIYRDDLLGAGFAGNAFVCEPVHNLVRRIALEPRGATFTGHREPRGPEEFLASSDNWFRPVQACTGPDGALWIVDMYRFVIEHPRWIPPARLAQLDVRAGADRGRIFRVRPRGVAPRRVESLARLDAEQLAARLSSPNGVVRDLAHRRLAHERPAGAVPVLEGIAAGNAPARCRAQALCALDTLGALRPELLLRALGDGEPRLRRIAVRLAETRLKLDPALARRARALADDPDPAVRYQLALSLGEDGSPGAAAVLGLLARRTGGNPWQQAAVLSSANGLAVEILGVFLDGLRASSAAHGELVAGLLATAETTTGPDGLRAMLPRIAAGAEDWSEPWRLAAVERLLETLSPRGLDAEEAACIRPLLAAARRLVVEPDAPVEKRCDALGLVGLEPGNEAEDLALLAACLAPQEPPEIAAAALASLARSSSTGVAALLLESWERSSPPRRAAILAVLFRREAWHAALLAAIEAEEMRPGDLSPEQRQRLLTSGDAAVRGRAARAFERFAPASRQAVLAAFQPALSLPGRLEAGCVVFAKLCTPCHAFRGQGQALGPDLASMAQKTQEALFTAVLDPNAAFEDKYAAFAAELEDGRVISGLVAGETATTLHFRVAGGLEEQVLRKDIRRLESTGRSYMAEGLEQGLAPQDLADLMAYVLTGPRALGATTPEVEAAARAALRATGLSGIDRVLEAYDVFQQPSWLGRVPMRYCRQNDGRGKVRWLTRPVPAGLKPDARHAFVLPVALGFISQPEGRFHLAVNGVKALDFNVAVDDAAWADPQGRVRASYVVHARNAEDSTGTLTLDVRGDLLEPGRPATLEVTGSAAGSERWFGVLLCPEGGPP